MVTDHNMAPVTGLELIGWARPRFPDLPILMISGDPDIGPDAIKAGANFAISCLRFAEVGELLAPFFDE
jgi:hypothetical protein